MSALSVRVMGRGKISVSIAVIGIGAFIAPAPAAVISASRDVSSSSGDGERRVAAIGTIAVGRTEQTFVDETRPTRANGTFAGAPNRT